MPLFFRKAPLAALLIMHSLSFLRSDTSGLLRKTHNTFNSWFVCVSKFLKWQSKAQFNKQTSVGNNTNKMLNVKKSSNKKVR
jgi:hypothetical protein